MISMVGLLEAFLILPHHLSHSLAHMKRKQPPPFQSAL
jgi:hypothetical protein